MGNILVMNNDPVVCGLFERVLQTAGHSVSLAANAAEGVGLLRRSAIDVVVTHCNMPEGDGLEVVSVLQHDFPATQMVLVASEDDPLQSCPLPAFVEVLSKPVEVSHLRATVHRMLARS